MANSRPDKAKVCVIGAVHNEGRFIKEAVSSIIAQTFADWEMVVIDDGSTDRTYEIILSFNDPRIRVVRQNQQGLTRSLNTALEMANSPYIARFDGDDISHPSRFARQVAFLDEHSNVYVVGTYYREIDPFGRAAAIIRYPVNPRDVKKALIRYNPVFHGSAMMRASLFDKIGKYDTRFPCAQDYDLWLRTAARYDIANISEVLAFRRYRRSNISIRRESFQSWCAVRARWRAVIRGTYPLYALMYCMRPLGVAILPAFLKRFARSMLSAIKIR